jgi:hypothetical protein
MSAVLGLPFKNSPRQRGPRSGRPMGLDRVDDQLGPYPCGPGRRLGSVMTRAAPGLRPTEGARRIESTGPSVTSSKRDDRRPAAFAADNAVIGLTHKSLPPGWLPARGPHQIIGVPTFRLCPFFDSLNFL